MKKFLAISFVMLLAVSDALACVGIITHNYYLFSVFCRETMGQPLFTSRLDNFWKSYTNGAVEQWQWHEDEIYAFAKARGDREMLNYLDELRKYLAISEQLGETWSYPTKEQLQERKQMLNSMIAKADAYKGSRLKNQWMLLRMRANMMLGNHQYNVDYWERTALRASDEGVYQDMMKNIYAGALMKTGKRLRACNIFAGQSDMLSLKWAMQKYRNLAGIKVIYGEDPNMPSLNYLVQDFVNNAQETLDDLTDAEKGYDNTEWMQMIDARNIQQQEAMQFIDFANKVLKEKKTEQPALWKAAIGELQYLYGDNDKAYNTLSEAMNMNGTQRMKDNARAIRIVASVGSSQFAKGSYPQWLVDEMGWLEEMRKQEPGYYNHYGEVLDRLIFEELAPRYQKAGQKNMAAALVGLFGKIKDQWDKEQLAEYNITEPDDSWNTNYYGDYCQLLSEMTGDELAAYYEWCKSPAKNGLEKKAKESINEDDEYYNDMIGTHYIAEGRFADAIGYLQKVSPKFMEGQNISYYLGNRNYAKPRWEGKQKALPGLLTEGAHLAKLSKNVKLEFCREMVDLEKQYRKTKSVKREKIAYDLATRYYQASSWGDCWYLSHYGWSCADTVATHEKDFVATAITLLNESKQSSDAKLKQASLYALAFIPLDPWAEEIYDWNTRKTTYLPNRTSRQYLAMSNFVSFQRTSNAPMPTYMSKCDVLKRFRATL